MKSSASTLEPPLRQAPTTSPLAWGLLILLSLIWGSSFILMKKSLQVFSSVQVGCLRIGIAFLLLSLVAIPSIKKIPRHKWKYLAISGFIGNFIPALLFAQAQTSLNSSVTGVLNALTPLFTLLVGVMVFGRTLRLVQGLGLAIGFIGSISLSFLKSDGSLGSMNLYVFYVIAATFCYGISTNVIKTYLSDVKALLVSANAMLTAGPVALAYLMTTDFVPRLTQHPGGWEALGYLFILGGIGTALALIFFNRLIQMTSAVVASTVTYLIPVVAVIWGAIDSEPLVLLHFVGMALIGVGVYLTNR